MIFIPALRLETDLGSTKAAGFAENVTESVKRCIECGESAERCPYHLPIPEILKENLALYEGHRDATQ
jgi:Fe-S oxidoreductase